MRVANPAYEPSSEIVSFVILGSFNPAILHPAWFAAHNFIGDDLARSAKIEFSNSDISIFEADWFRIEAFADRILIKITNNANVELGKELLENILNLLEHTPLKALGLNSNTEYRLSKEQYKQIGDALAPKEIWINLFNEPGLSTMSVQGKIPNSISSYVKTQVASVRSNVETILIHTNLHYDLTTDIPEQYPNPLGKLNEILRTEWPLFINLYPHVEEQLLANTLGEAK